MCVWGGVCDVWGLTVSLFFHFVLIQFWEGSSVIPGLDEQIDQSESCNSPAKPRICLSHYTMVFLVKYTSIKHNIWKISLFSSQIQNVQHVIKLNALKTDCILDLCCCWTKTGLVLTVGLTVAGRELCCGKVKAESCGRCGMLHCRHAAGSPWIAMEANVLIWWWRRRTLGIKCSSVSLPAGCAPCLS